MIDPHAIQSLCADSAWNQRVASVLLRCAELNANQPQTAATEAAPTYANLRTNKPNRPLNCAAAL